MKTRKKYNLLKYRVEWVFFRANTISRTSALCRRIPNIYISSPWKPLKTIDVNACNCIENFWKMCSIRAFIIHNYNFPNNYPVWLNFNEASLVSQSSVGLNTDQSENTHDGISNISGSCVIILLDLCLLWLMQPLCYLFCISLDIPVGVIFFPKYLAYVVKNTTGHRYVRGKCCSDIVPLQKPSPSPLQTTEGVFNHHPGRTESVIKTHLLSSYARMVGESLQQPRLKWISPGRRSEKPVLGPHW